MNRTVKTYWLLLLVMVSATGRVGMAEQLGSAKQPTFARAEEASYFLTFDGVWDKYLRAISENWLKVAPDRNPAILGMFADREKEPPQFLLPWSGEFAGKHLTGAVQVLRLTKDKELRDTLQSFVDRLVKLQTQDGYLGPWPKAYQLSGKSPNLPVTWDAWNHYHIMIGLLFWHEQTGDGQALNAARGIGDLLCNLFLGKPGKLAGLGETYANLTPVHSLCLLYKATGGRRYLDLARQIVEDEFPKGGDYVQTALAGKEFYQTPQPRWESLHAIMGLAEMYWITGEEKYRDAFEHIWWSIVKLDRHNTGGFSSGEQAKGNPYDSGAIETCCSIAWSAMSVEMLRLTGNSIVADELELTLMNAITGYQSRTGHWCTYDTPMDGRRIPFTTFMTGHMRPGSEELSCCTVNSARGFGMISDWALMTDRESLIVNWYGDSIMSAKLKDISVSLKQQTDYPQTGHILLKVLPIPQQGVDFTLKLRIPHWSKKTRVAINGELVKDVTPGSYLVLFRNWRWDDRIEMDLDMSLHYWAGERQLQDKASIYYGPVLLAYGVPAGRDPEDAPVFDAENMNGRMVKSKNADGPIVLMECSDIHGNKINLTDFDSAGENGQHYISWLNVRNAPKAAFSKTNPLRSSPALPTPGSGRVEVDPPLPLAIGAEPKPSDLQKAPGQNEQIAPESLVSIPAVQSSIPRQKPQTGDVIENSIGMKLVWVPAGEFMMGSNEGEPDERPVHKVKLTKGFFMAQTEVTQSQYGAIMGRNPSLFKGDGFPVETVSWIEAVEFCKKLSRREGKTYCLPAEAEWEFACRAGTSTVFSFGDSEANVGDYAWYFSNSGWQSHPTGQEKANPLGLYDMHGGVWEWCADWYGEDYYSQSLELDPTGPATGELRVLRGGSWCRDASFCRSASRDWYGPDHRTPASGFRVVLSVSSQDFQ
jgi:formylglycine-generating enzyme required for sulfatase activity/DUF1680 family protein